MLAKKRIILLLPLIMVYLGTSSFIGYLGGSPNISITEKITFLDTGRKNCKKLGNNYDQIKEQKKKVMIHSLNHMNDYLQESNFNMSKFKKNIDLNISGSYNDIAEAEVNIRANKNIDPYMVDFSFHAKFGNSNNAFCYLPFIEYGKISKFQTKFATDVMLKMINKKGLFYKEQKIKKTDIEGKTLIIHKDLIDEKLTEKEIKSKLPMNVVFMESLDEIDRILDKRGEDYLVYIPYKMLRSRTGRENCKGHNGAGGAGGNAVGSISRFSPRVYDYKNRKYYRFSDGRVPLFGVTTKNFHNFDKKTLKKFSKIK